MLLLLYGARHGCLFTAEATLEESEGRGDLTKYVLQHTNATRHLAPGKTGKSISSRL